MARDIAGATLNTNRIDWTGLTAIDTGDWTIAQWMYVRSATNGGKPFSTVNGSNQSPQILTLASSVSTAMIVRQDHATTNASCTSGTALTTNTWSLVVGMFDSTGAMGTANRTHVFQGDVATPMFQPTETLVTAAGARRTGGTGYRLGNGPAAGAVGALDGILSLTLVYTRLLSLAEAEGIRNGMVPADFLYAFPVTSQTLATLNELKTGSGGSITGAAVAVAEDPPVNLWVPATAYSVGTPAAAATQTISPSGIASAEAWGSATVTPGAVTIAPTGIASAEAWGTATIAAPVTIAPTGIPSAEAWGAPTVTPGDVTISPTGIPSEEAWGTPIISRTAMFDPPADATVPPIYLAPDSYAPVPALAQRLFRHYKPRLQGRNVYKLVDGTYTETVPYPNIDASTQPGQAGETTVAQTYLGGHRYPVTADEAAALTAAGYGAYVS